MCPRITGQLIVILTVRDIRRSADWYRELLDAREHAYLDESGALRQVTLPTYTANAILTFRDPDNIQLEFFWSPPTDHQPTPRA